MSNIALKDLEALVAAYKEENGYYADYDAAYHLAGLIEKAAVLLRREAWTIKKEGMS